MSRRTIHWTRSDVENGMRANARVTRQKGKGEGEEKKRPRDEFHPETRKGSGEGKVERIRSNSWNRRGGASFLFMH